MKTTRPINKPWHEWTDQERQLNSDLAGQTFDPKENRVRPELAAQTQTDVILAKFGMGPRRPIYGEINFDMTLRSALETRDRAIDMFEHLPAPLAEKFKTPADLAAGLYNGKVLEAIKTTMPDNQPGKDDLISWLDTELAAYKARQATPKPGGTPDTPKPPIAP